jgi:hypothetical protein
MKYLDGCEARLGDRVELWEGNVGIVVALLDRQEYSAEYPRGQWEYLGSGVLILSENASLVHYKEPQPTMRLLSRGTAEKI